MCGSVESVPPRRDALQSGGRAAVGVLLVNKPAGPTSHDVVAVVRKGYRIRRVGHLGTLDPAASGLLVVLVGNATRLAPFAERMDKEYVADIVLGMRTETYDREGQVIEERDATHLTADHVQLALADFVGELQQLPPPFSAVKSKGKPLYELARAGAEVPLEPRSVRVDRLELLQFFGSSTWSKESLTAFPSHLMGELPCCAPCSGADRSVSSVPKGAGRMPALLSMLNQAGSSGFSAVARWLGAQCKGKVVARLRVVCSAGTYVRSLAADLGEKLGTGGVLGALVRTRVGGFALDGAVSLAQLKTGPVPELLPADALLAGFPSLRLSADDVSQLQRGRRVKAPASGTGVPPVKNHGQDAHATSDSDRNLVKVYSEGGTFIGVAEVLAENILHAVRLMPL